MSARLVTVTVAVALVCLTPAAFAATVQGTSAGETLTGTATADTVLARAGDDTVQALAGNDSVWGGRGRDHLLGGKGADVLRGGPGRDTIDTGRDNVVDTVYGNGRADRIYATFNDQVWGGRGDDQVRFTYGNHGSIDCGPGQDTVVFNQPSPRVHLVGCETVKVVSAG